MSHRGTVAVVEWNWGGHNHTYYKHYLAALVRSGAAVVPVMSEPQLLEEMFASSPLSDLGTGKRSIALPVSFEPSNAWRIRPGRLAVQLGAWSTFHRLGRVLREWEREHGRPIDLVFFACMYDVGFPRASLVSHGLKRPWSGLYLQSHVFHSLRNAGEARRLRKARVMFDSRRLVAIGMLEPVVLELVRKAVPTVSARIFPDTLEPISAVETDAAASLRRAMLAKAEGRPIVSLLGALQPSKGVELFLRAACDPRLADVSFFMGGPLPLGQFAPTFRARVEDCMHRAPRLHCRLERLSEDQFNAAVSASDVLCASYINFPFSSNVQVKAAQLHKPVVVTDGTLMAARCREYRLGECIPENDLESLVAALQRILSNAPDRQNDPTVMALHDQFAAMNSPAAVCEAMEWVLASAGL